MRKQTPKYSENRVPNDTSKMDIEYKHIPVTIDFYDYEDGIKNLLQQLGVQWKSANIKSEVWACEL